MKTRKTCRSARMRQALTLACLLLVSWLATGCAGKAHAQAAAPGTAADAQYAAPMAPEEPSHGAPGMEAHYAMRKEGASPAPPAAEPADYGALEAAVATGSDAVAAAKMAQTARPPVPEPKAAPDGSARPEVATDAVQIQQLLVYTAQLRMAVFEVAKALNEVEALARSLGGFLAQRTDNEITIRVPVEQFDDAMKGISGKGDVLTRNVQVQDVTEEFLDLSLRLKNARQVRERIVQLLASSKNVEESLAVERELSRLSAEIERIEGRLKYLRDRARYSTITVSFQPVAVDDERVGRVFQLPFPWLQELGLGRLMNLR